MTFGRTSVWRTWCWTLQSIASNSAIGLRSIVRGYVNFWKVFDSKFISTKETGVKLFYAWLGDRIIACLWLALTLKKKSFWFGNKLFCFLRGSVNLPLPVFDKVGLLSFLRGEFKYVPQIVQYLWKHFAHFECRTPDQLSYLIVKKFFRVNLSTEIARSYNTFQGP